MFALATLLYWAAVVAEPLPAGAVARFGSARLRTSAEVFALSPDGRTFRTITGGRTVGTWDCKTGKLIGEVRLDGAATAEAHFAPDRQRAAIIDTDGTGLYDCLSGKRLRTLVERDPADMAIFAFSPNGATLATTTFHNDKGTGTGRIHLVPVAGGKAKHFAELPSYANGLAFSPDGKRLFAAVDNHSLRCWDLATGAELWKNEHWARHISVSPDGKILASDTYQDGPPRLWNAATGEAIAKLDTGKRSWSRQVAFSADNKLVGIGTNDGVQIWDVKTEKLIRSFAGAGPHFAFLPDGESVYTFGPIIEKWNLKTGRSVFADARRAGPVGAVNHLAFSPDGRSLASQCFADETIRIWNRSTGEPMVYKAFGGFAMSYTPAGKLIVPCEGGNIALIEPENGKRIRTFELALGHKKIATSVAVVSASRDGKTLLALGKTTHLTLSRNNDLYFHEPLQTWDLETGKLLLDKSILVSMGSGSKFAPGGKWLARIGESDLVGVESGRVRPLVPQCRSFINDLVFSPDGRWISLEGTGATGAPSDHRLVALYEVQTGRRLFELKIGDPFSQAFSPDGRLLAATTADALHVFEVPTGKEVLGISTKPSTSLAFAPDGRSVATGHADGTILVWDMTPASKGMTVLNSPVEPDRCWKDLADGEPKIAWAAIERLASDPPAAMKLLNAKLKPVIVDAKWLAARIADLSSGDFKTRETATKELKAIAEAGRSYFVQARKLASTAEAIQRLDELIDYEPAVPDNETIRELRALAVLERLGSKDAVELLKKLATGAPNAELTREAKEIAARLCKE